MKIKELRYNWYIRTQDGKSYEDWESAKVGREGGRMVGKSIVTKIEKVAPLDYTQREHYLIYHENNEIVKVYNPNLVVYSYNNDKQEFSEDI